MLGETIGYRVTVLDENGLKVQHEQDFMNADFGDALQRAKEHARKVRRLWPDGVADVSRLVLRLSVESL